MVDEALARELELFSENDEQIYRSMTLAWYRNFRRKMKRGVYNHALAVKGIAENFVPQVARQYRKNYGDFGNVDRDTKYYLGERFVKHFEVEYGSGEFDSKLGV